MKNRSIIIKEITIDVLCHLHKTASATDNFNDLERKAINYLESTTLYFSRRTYQQIAGLAISDYLTYCKVNHQSTIH